MADKVRLGLVGCGPRGIYITGLFKSNPRCEVTAVMDIYRKPAETAATQLGIPHDGIHTDFHEMLEKAPVDALYFACDPIVQADLACQAMKAGKDVCTDVPAAFTIDECWRLVRTVEETGRKYQLLEQLRFWGFIDVWTQMRERGDLGHVCLAQGEYMHYDLTWNRWIDAKTGDNMYQLKRPSGRDVVPSWRERVHGDPIWYLPHTMSPILKILGDRVERVACMGTRQGSYRFPEVGPSWRDLQYALMHTAGDTVILAGTGFTIPQPERGVTGYHWYELRGTKATVESPKCRDDSFRTWREGMETYEKMHVSTTPLGASAEKAGTSHGGADYKPVETFINAIVDATTPALDVYTMAELTAPAILAAESARRGGVMLEVPDFRRS